VLSSPAGRNVLAHLSTVKAKSTVALSTHPLQTGDVFYSRGGHFTYRVIGACCRLFDRDELPWPCCRLEWRGKEPSWRRIGRRFTPDLASRNSPSYCVEILDRDAGEPFVLTLYWVKLDQAVKSWWYVRRASNDSTTIQSKPD
jgi:hypothetical protein